MAKPNRIEIENVLQPGKTYHVDSGKFAAMREAMLAVLPSTAPGLTPAEIKAQVLGRLPEALFPGGERAGWWIKAVQLDLEAKSVIARAPDAPVRLYRS
ncbi:DUF6958 family protein [Sphingomonas sp.]|jgi:hypothetical protein|uniref:DUF6958 family protein n=1 Tax=Sphingomonas sp. TaxID=28214 RepID=UPI002EDB9EAA